MPHAKFTPKSIAKLKPPKRGQIVYWDSSKGSPPGFGLRIGKTKRKTWILYYRLNGKQKRRALGGWPAVTLSDARHLATETHRRVASGKEPESEKTIPTTIEELLEQYLEKKGASLASTSLQNWTWMAKKIALYPVAQVPPSEVRQRHLIGFAEELAYNQRKKARANGKSIGERYGEVYANRCCQFVKIVFAWAVERGKAQLDFNPLAGMKKPFKEESSRDALTEEKLRVLVPVIEGMDILYRAYFMLLLLTGSRATETRLAKWEDIDFKERTWTKPKENTKKRREHIVPLTDEMISLLRVLQFRTGRWEWVFASPEKDGAPIARPSHQANKLREVIGGWVPHEFRNTVITGLEALGTPTIVVAAVVGHKIGGQTAHYNKYEYIPQKRKALEAWGKFLNEIVAGEASYESGASFPNSARK